MHYVPGTIVLLFGVAYLIRAAFAQGDQRRQFIINALIDFGIAAVIMLVFNRQ